MTHSIKTRLLGLSGLALAFGLVSAPVVRADDTSSQPGTVAAPQQTAVPQQQAEVPQGQAQRQVPSNFNPNALPPDSEYRNGNGDPIDPQTGLPDSSYEEHMGGGF